MSFAKNSAGIPETIEINDYYAFGMNHLGADNLSGFGQGAYQNYKYNGKELQETGFLDYGWRQYMPDLGRWFGMDQLSENYLSYSPYAYVMNNPVMYNDVDGRYAGYTEFKIADTEDGGGGDPEPGGGFYFSSWHLGNDGGTDAWNGLSNWGNGDNDSSNNDYSGWWSAVLSLHGMQLNGGLSNSNFGYLPLGKSTLLNYVSSLYPGLSGGALQQKAGMLFENAFNSIMGIDYSSLNYESNDVKIAGMYKGKLRNTIPDGVFDLIHDEYHTVLGVLTPIPKSSRLYPSVQFAEVKAMDGTLYSSSNQGQISSMLYSMSKNNGVSDYGGQFIIGTTADTKISSRIFAEGLRYNIQVVQMTAQYKMINGFMQIRLYNGGLSPSSAFIK